MSVMKQFTRSMVFVGIGVILIGGGTFAYFSDTEMVNNKIAAGTIDLDVASLKGNDINFNLSDVKPGDHMTRKFLLKNAGTLDIKEVLLRLQFDSDQDFVDGKDVNDSTGKKESALDYLSQYELQVFKTSLAIKSTKSETDLLKQLKSRTGKQSVTLKDLYELTQNEKLNVAYKGLLIPKLGVIRPIDNIVEMKVGFLNSDYDQNKYQGDSIKLAFQMEATQWEGVKRDTRDKPPVIVDK